MDEGDKDEDERGVCSCQPFFIFAVVIKEKRKGERAIAGMDNRDKTAGGE